MRYVPDPIRNEAKNIGIVLLCPEKGFGKSKFLKSRFHLQRDSRRYATLQSIIRGYQIDLPGEYKENLYERTLFAPIPPQWTKADLEKLSHECTNLIQFSRPSVLLGDPEESLNELFQERVQVKRGGNRTTQIRKNAANIFKRTFHSYGLEDAVEEDADISVHSHKYRFDIGIKNGKLHYAIKTLDFQKADLQRVEEAGGYYAHIWHTVQSETGAKGLWLVKPPSKSDAIEERFKLVTSWAEEAEIEVHNINETEEVAKKIAVELNNHSPSHYSFQQ